MKLFFDSMKFLFSVIAAYVGIRAVVNSSKSAKLSAESVRIATESIRVTKEKEQREQSPHLIALSESIEIPLTIPMYKKRIENLKLNVNTSLINHYDKDFYRQAKDPEYIKGLTDEEYIDIQEYIKEIEKFKEYLTEIRKFRLDYRETEHSISVFNSGKGTAVNIEYEFIFENREEFIGYSFLAKHDNPSLRSIPRYSIEIFHTIGDEIPMLSVANLNIENEVSKLSPLTGHNEGYYPIYQNETINFSVVPSGETRLLQIPVAFSILMKHYIICKYYKQYFNHDLMFLNEIIDVFREEKAILPKAKIIIRYTDDELTRSISNKKDKVELVYQLELKESKLIFKDDTISNIYLEAKYVGSKKS